MSAGGGRIENKGQCSLVLETSDGGSTARNIFQVAQVIRNCMSVRTFCDNGNTFAFTKGDGVVRSHIGKAIRISKCGTCLYIAKVAAKRGEHIKAGNVSPPVLGSEVGHSRFRRQGVTD